MFIDTTSIYFEGQGGATIGKRGYSKDHRPDLQQMIVVVVMDDEGRPVCCEMLPGNTADIKTLLPVVDRLRQRFDIRDVCVVADRGMISEKTIAELTDRGIHYILGARLRNVKEIRETVLSRGGRYREVHGPRQHSKSPSPMKVKQVFVEERRYIVCHNDEQARKDQHDREAILEKLREQLQQGGTSLVGNKGYRKYLIAAKGGAYAIDEAKVKRDARFDGKWVLRTDTDLPAEEVALRYKDLLLFMVARQMNPAASILLAKSGLPLGAPGSLAAQRSIVEDAFRTAKSILETRPIFHKCDDTIRGHVFCSFLALVLLKELQSRLESRSWRVEWQQLRDDLDELQELTLPLGEKTFVIRTPPVGQAGRALQAVGVTLGSSVRLLG